MYLRVNSSLFLTTLCFFLVSCKYKTNGNSALYRVCYYTLWDPLPSKLNASLCTHIIAGFSSVVNGEINLGHLDDKILYLATTKLKDKFPQLKVLISVGGGGNEAGFSQAFNSSQSRMRFIKSALTILSKYNFDGLDIDWEFPVWNDQVPEDKENFILFLKEFKIAAKHMGSFRNECLLSVAVAAIKNIIDQSYDIPQMAKYVDFINLMSYDYHDYLWYTPFTGHNSPLFNRTVEKAYFGTLNTAWSSMYWYEQGMPKAKIMVGIPTYAHTYTLLDPKEHKVDSPATGFGPGDGDITYAEVCDFLASGGVRVFDNESQVPYAYRGYDWISYEDCISIQGKAAWIKQEGFGGAMTFKLNTDDWSGHCETNMLFPLHQIIYTVFNS